MDEGKNKKFISERILGRNLTLGRALKFIAVSLLCGAAFGGAAFGVYYLAARKADEAKQAEIEASIAESERASEAEKERRHLRETTAAVPETSPQETPGSQDETVKMTEDVPEPSSEAETGENGETAEETENPLEEEEIRHVREILAEEREGYVYTREDLGRILEAQKEACTEISRSIVKVSSFISETTWFESTVETERVYAGIIIDKKEEEILVLTVNAAAKGSDRLNVTFFDGGTQVAEVRKASERDGWMVLSVKPEGLSPECVEALESTEYVALEDLSEGIPVITAGAPMGVVNSFGFGFINYIEDVRSEVDGSSVCCCTAAQSSPALGTFLMTVDGGFIGLGVNHTESSGETGSRFLVADSCSVMLENLKKGNDSAWLGITGTDIRTDNQVKKLPEGMYVTDVEENGPAYAAGLKRGDIIVNIGSREIGGLSDYCSFMRNLRPDETIRMTILREAIRSEYKELEIEMTAGTR